MHFYEYASIVVNIGLFVVGMLVAFIANYFKFASDIAFIKGQLSEVLKSHDEITGLVQKHVKLESDFSKTAKDLDKLYLRIKVIETRFINAIN